MANKMWRPPSRHRSCSRHLSCPRAAAPHRGDLAVNVALGITLIWLPLSIAGEGRPLLVPMRLVPR